MALRNAFEDVASEATLAALLADSQAKADLSETQPVSAASLPLPAGAATAANQATLNAKDFATEATQAASDTKLGGVTETAPASDTASSGLNGRLQRIAQRLTSLIALLPTSLGQKTMANGLAVTVASDQSAVPVSGTVSVNALPAGTANIGDVDVLTLPALPAGSNNIGQVDPRGNVAHDGADAGNPVKTGGRARTALPAAVAQDDRSDTITDKHGRTLVANAPIDQRASGKANYTNTTAADVIAAPGASVAVVVTTLLVTNAHATVGTKVEIRDGTTVKLIGQASKDGGGFNLHDPDGLFIATANTAVTARCVTTGTDVDVFISGYKIPA